MDYGISYRCNFGGNDYTYWIDCDKATYETQQAQALQGEMPDVFKDFSF